jgi:hypothetical protein
MKDKFLVVVIDDLNIVSQQKLCETYKQAQDAQLNWRVQYANSNKEVRIQLLTDSSPETDYKVITLSDNWA